MLQKIGAGARAVAVILAIVAAFVAIPTLDVALLLLVLGLIAGLALTDADRISIIVTALALPLLATVLNALPTVGPQLAAAANNLGVVAAASAATLIAIGLFDLVKGDLMGLAGKS